MTEIEDSIPLSDFIANLRRELASAQQEAAGEPLKLGVEEITMTLDIAFSRTASGEVSAKGSGRFLVFLSAEAAAKAAASGEWSRTHSVTLTLKPRIEEIVTGPDGERTTIIRNVDVGGELSGAEESPELPTPRTP